MHIEIVDISVILNLKYLNKVNIKYSTIQY
jgi:hypothetical protein